MTPSRKNTKTPASARALGHSLFMYMLHLVSHHLKQRSTIFLRHVLILWVQETEALFISLIGIVNCVGRYGWQSNTGVCRRHQQSLRDRLVARGFAGRRAAPVVRATEGDEEQAGEDADDGQRHGVVDVVGRCARGRHRRRRDRRARRFRRSRYAGGRGRRFARGCQQLPELLGRVNPLNECEQGRDPQRRSQRRRHGF